MNSFNSNFYFVSPLWAPLVWNNMGIHHQTVPACSYQIGLEMIKSLIV